MMRARRGWGWALVAVVGGLAVHEYSQRSMLVKLSDGTVVDSAGLWGAELTDVRSHKRSILQRQGRPDKYVLYVFLSPTDCPSCLAETEAWSELQASMADRVEFVAVAVRCSLAEAEQYSRDFAPGFTVWHDTGDVLPEKMHLPFRTPFKLLMSEGGRPVAAAEASIDDSAFLNSVSERLGRGHVR